MLPRIAHRELEIITGRKTSEDYLKMQQKMGKFYLANFLKIIARQGKKGDFLEIGCGAGYQTAIVAKEFDITKLHVIEPSPDMINIARSYLKNQGLGDKVKFSLGSVEDDALVQGLGEFDLIYSSFSLHHWKHPVRALKNLYSVLKKNGVLFVYDFERHWLTYYLPFGRKGICESIRASYTPKEIEIMLSDLNLKKDAIKRSFPYLYLLIKK